MKWNSPSEVGNKVLEGSLEEVWISWAADQRYGGRQGAQQYIEQQVAIGNVIETRGKDLLHGPTKRQVGVLANKKIYHTGRSNLRVAAVLRYPQLPDSEYYRDKPGAFDKLIPEVKKHGWSYVVLVSGVLKSGQGS